jgi:uncharacterized tellurite resistance protein B-like protein
MWHPTRIDRGLRTSSSRRAQQVVCMFGSLKAFFARLGQDAGLQNRLDGDDCRVATAALLIRVATVDREMSQGRRSKLHAILKSGFGLDDVAAAALIDAAAAAEQSATDLYHFTRRLNDMLDHDRRRRVVGMMWEMAHADGRVNEFAGNIIWRAADLLGVSSRERIDLRRRIAAESDARCSARAMEQMPDGAIESHAS